jgi:hypothetical protein
MSDEVEEILPSQLFESRLTNVEYNQILVTGDFLRNISQVIQLTQPHITKMPLIRIGKNGDGGYVIAPVVESKLCLNLGVGFEVSADLDLIGRDFKIYAFDGTVPNPLPEASSYTFIQKNIGYTDSEDTITNLQEIFNAYPDLNHLDLVLLDIEGHEYRVLREELEFITKAKQIVVEFHGLELLADFDFAEDFIKTLNELSKTHMPIHAHANNSGGELPLGGASWPTILEVTFLLKEFCTENVNYGPFPGTLDYPNVDLRPDINLTPFYGLHKSYAVLVRTILGLS